MVAMVMLLVAMLVAVVIGLLYHPLDHFAAVPIFQFDFLGTVTTRKERNVNIYL